MEKVQKLVKIALWLLMGISVVIIMVMFLSIDNEQNPGATAQRWITININWSIILLVIATAIALIFAIVQMLTDKAQAIRSLIVIALLGVILLISYSASSSEIPNFTGAQKLIADGTLTPSVSKWVGEGLIYTYVMGIAAILTAVGFAVASIFKR